MTGWRGVALSILALSGIAPLAFSRRPPSPGQPDPVIVAIQQPMPIAVKAHLAWEPPPPCDETGWRRVTCLFRSRRDVGCRYVALGPAALDQRPRECMTDETELQIAEARELGGDLDQQDVFPWHERGAVELTIDDAGTRVLLHSGRSSMLVYVTGDQLLRVETGSWMIGRVTTDGGLPFVQPAFVDLEQHFWWLTAHQQEKALAVIRAAGGDDEVASFLGSPSGLYATAESVRLAVLTQGICQSTVPRPPARVLAE